MKGLYAGFCFIRTYYIGRSYCNIVSNDIIYIPEIYELLYPILAVIPLQLFAYYIADKKECDIRIFVALS